MIKIDNKCMIFILNPEIIGVYHKLRRYKKHHFIFRNQHLDNYLIRFQVIDHAL